MSEEREKKIYNFLEEAQKRGKKISQKIKGDENIQSAGKIINTEKEASVPRPRKPKQAISQSIRGNKNIQVGGDMINVITPKTPEIKYLPPINSIGGDPLLKQAIQERFNQLGEEREKRFGKSAYPVMYKNFKKAFGIKNNPWTVIWVWPKECARAIIDYLDKKFANTIQGRIERAASREDYIHTRPHLYKREKELLDHLGLNLSSLEVKRLLSEYFGVSSHSKLSHLQHWQWICYLEGQVKKLEEQ
ncbi:MAG: hypothetical protein HY096_08690 [Nitrospinae bacterium]|nr:hypothetical protein [Nitrospinota bacterium]